MIFPYTDYIKPDKGLMRNQPIIAIDGPAGAGKSTVARLIAKELDYIFLDTGAMYRSVALLADRQKIAWDDPIATGKVAESMRIEFEHHDHHQTVIVNGEDITVAIRTPHISHGASVVAQWPAVIEALTVKQREIAKNGGVVMDGRNTGTAVFPDAEVKIFLTASPEARAKRRLLDLAKRGELELDETKILEEIKQRDKRDTERTHAPLKKADDAVEILTDNLTIEETKERIVEMVRSKIQKTNIKIQD